MVLLLTIAFLIYSGIEGYREAFYWYYHVYGRQLVPNESINKIDLHQTFLEQRIIVGVSFSLLYLFYLLFTGVRVCPSLIAMGSFSFSLACMFSFMHNGEYYKQRNIIDPGIYQERYFANSLTSTAKMEFNSKSRFILFIIGSLIILSLEIWSISLGVL